VLVDGHIRAAVRAALSAPGADPADVRDLALVLCGAKQACYLARAAHRPWSPAESDLIAAAAASGLSVVWADDLGRSVVTVSPSVSAAAELSGLCVRMRDLSPGEHRRVGLLLGYPETAVSIYGRPTPRLGRSWTQDERRFLLCRGRPGDPVVRAWAAGLLRAFSTAYGEDAVAAIPDMRSGR
jgi:hypothetical protein